MNFALREELKALMEKSEGPCVSMYMPTHRAGAEVQQDPIRLSNLIREAEKQLMTFGLRSPEAKGLLGPAYELQNDNFFWRAQAADGLALFISPDLFRNYRLPIHFEPLTMVTHRFHLKPLLPLFGGDGSFYVLALSQKDIRLLRCTRFGVEEVELKGVPRSIDEALRFDDAQRQQRFHTRVTGTVGGTSGDSSIFRGHGTGVNDSKTDLLRYFLKVNDGLREVFKDQHAPLVVAGVDYLLPIYREANTYPYLVEGGISGNPEGMSARELHAQAWPLVQPHFEQEREDAAARFLEAAGTGLASSHIEEVVPAAYYGRVGSLFLPVGVRRWGVFSPNDGSVKAHDEPESGDEDLLGFAAIHTFLQGGDVYVVEPEQIPGGNSVAALFRY